jgi:hypothetical protein
MFLLYGDSIDHAPLSKLTKNNRILFNVYEVKETRFGSKQGFRTLFRMNIVLSVVTKSGYGSLISVKLFICVGIPGCNALWLCSLRVTC